MGYDNYVCPYCMGYGKLKAMQSASVSPTKSARVQDTSVTCKHCKGTGIIVARRSR